MVVTREMQNAVHRQMRIMMGKHFFLLARFARHDGGTQHDVTQQRVAAWIVIDEREYVSGIIPAAESAVEIARFGSVDDSNRHLRRLIPHGANPALEISFGGQIGQPACKLNRE